MNISQLELYMLQYVQVSSGLNHYAGLVFYCWVYSLSFNLFRLKMFTEHRRQCLSYLYIFNVMYRQVSFLVVTQAFQVPVVVITLFHGTVGFVMVQ